MCLLAKLLYQMILKDNKLIKSLYSLLFSKRSSASNPPIKKSLKSSPSYNIAGSDIGDHIEYLPPISFGNWIMFSLKPKF